MKRDWNKGNEATSRDWECNNVLRLHARLQRATRKTQRSRLANSSEPVNRSAYREIYDICIADRIGRLGKREWLDVMDEPEADVRSQL